MSIFIPLSNLGALEKVDSITPAELTRSHAAAVDMSQDRNDSVTRIPVYINTAETIAGSQLTAFAGALEAYTGQVFPTHEALHEFSVREYRTFWQCFIRWSQGLSFSGSIEPACIGDECEHARFFPEAHLNYADNLLNLSVAPAEAPALTACYADGQRVHLTRGQLRERVARLAQALSALGLSSGDRVVGVMRNDASAVVTALAVTALGATLSTAAPEMGVEAILDRFSPLQPRLLFAHTAARAFDMGISLADNVAELAAALPSVQGVIRLDDGVLPETVRQPAYALDELIQAVPVDDPGRFVWRHFPFNHPLFIMFSSGTTGKPKCIMHGAGGSLLEHLKEHRLHTDLRPGDSMYFHTSCAWMMWNWQLSALASGVEIVTYDGPLSTIDKLWSLVAQERVTVFGTSPAYLKMCEDAGLIPGRQLDLGELRTILSTGAVLHDEQFNWVRDHVKPIPVQSISGGTDILGCFVLGNPRLAVYAGEAQCRSLALDVQAWGQGGRADEIGELVCTNPFPSRPLGFFGDADGTAFHAAYFAQNPGYWTHGDLIEFSPQGSARLHGRSDGILNVRGINVAPVDIYRVLRDVEEIREAMVVEQRARALPFDESTHPDHAPPEPIDQRVVLLLVLRNGALLNGALMTRVLGEIARRLSAAHVPARIIAVDELPVTHNGKLSEAAARSAVNGLPIGNATALRNPGCLDAIRNHPALHVECRALPEVGNSREQLELHLKAQWENLFGFTPVSLNDNFFELGGNSLLGARLLAALHHSTGRSLPLASLLLAPTIKRMAALIVEGTPGPATPGPVLIRPGTGRPIFLVHGLSGSVMECWALVEALQSSRPVYGLQARGLDGEQPPQDRVEDIAGSYIEQMRTVQQIGPYAVAGYSFGGLVALEIAQQLLRAGDQTEPLCMLDTYAQQDLPWSKRVQYHCVRAWRTLGRLPAAQVPGFLAARLTQIVGLGPDYIGPGKSQFTGRPLAQLPAAQQLVYNTMLAALAAYRPQPYQGGPVLYVRAAVELGTYFNPLPLWQRVASRGLIVVEVPDGHLDMVGPNAHLVAAAIDRELDKALA